MLIGVVALQLQSITRKEELSAGIKHKRYLLREKIKYSWQEEGELKADFLLLSLKEKHKMLILQSISLNVTL